MLKFIFAIFFFCPFLAEAQSVIIGRVITRNGEAVSGVNIFCPEIQQGTITDSTGYFSLKAELPCQLEFSHINYKKTTHLVKGNTPFTVILRNKFNNLQEVIVSGRTSPGRLYSSRKGIETVPAILGEQDLLKYLATVPGIITTNALDPGIYVRGGNSWENSFLIHDVEIAGTDHLTGILATFDPYIFNNSTLYKSGFPAAYNGSLSSYINMIPDPGNKQKLEGELTLGLVSSALKAKGPLKKNHTSFAASLRTSYLQAISKLYNRSVKGNNTGNLLPEYAFNDLSLSVDSRLSSQWNLSAFGIFSMDNLTMKLQENVRYDFNWKTFSGNLRTLYTPNEKNRFRLSIGGKSSFSEGDAKGSIPMGGGNRRYSLITQISYTGQLNDQLQFLTGGKFEHARFETADKPDYAENLLIKSSDKYFNLYEAYAEVNYRHGNHFLLVAGLNYQHYRGNSRINSLSPRAKISYFTGKFTLWLDYAQTTQYLSLYPYFTVKTPVDIWYPLDKGMKPALCRQISIGAEQEIPIGLTLYAGLFYKNMQHLKDFSANASTRYSGLTDNMIEGKGYARGFELDLSFQQRNLHLRFNYTLSESKRKFKEINNGQAFNPPYDVKHNIVINSSLYFSSRFSLNLLWTFSSGVYTTFPVGVALAHNITDSENKPILIPVYTDRYNYKLPDNHRLDANLDYLFPYKRIRLKISAGAYNVYNHSNPSFVYFNPEENENGKTKFIPKSKVILPFIPYISLHLNW